ncbi:hypothetical protein FRC00_000834 [Tulasnella sp. 408]|nr:hypothetical protein FRC00_000834 [Tulasnella sp. 408]
MPPKNNTSFWSSMNGPFQYTVNAAGFARNAAEPGAPAVVRGLAELVEVLDAMAASPLGARPKLNSELIKSISNSPLEPVLKALNPVYKKLGPLEGSPEHLQAQAAQVASTPGSGPSSTQQPTPAAASAAAAITKTEAGLISVSSKLNSVSQAVTDMKNSTKTAKEQLEATRDQVEAVEKRVSQVSGQLDPALTELAQEVKRLQVDLIDEFKGERTRLETKVKGLEAKVNQLNNAVDYLEKYILQLIQEADDRQQVIHDTRAELSAVEVASEMALQGTFSDEGDTMGVHEGTDEASGDLLQTAKKVRNNTLGLITKCRALFAVINSDLETVWKGNGVDVLNTYE